MKNKLLPFLCGALTTVICIGTVFAGSNMTGTVSFNTADFFINGTRILASGENIMTEKGASVPASVLYTDENGGGTYYVPVRELAKKLSIPTDWDGDGVYWQMYGDYALALMPEVNKGGMFNDCIEEIDAVVPENGVKLFSDYSNTEENYEKKIEMVSGAGNYVSITVTNHSNWRPVQFDLGITTADGVLVMPTKVPEGKTITRTFRVLSEEERADTVPIIRVGSPDEVSRRNLFTVTAVQFDGK